ncbi:ABC transporter [Plasmodium gonderi]|uniref:ABC transporter n=1 Tax=Plasmodium gonderi TaxID=77519 RepID=A0A1Y1JPR6_PLAGO|nr:ABC transporter [Plasmodium gonderi]GAW82832.1 ABC transporter [Plasmodium gonderi]
MFIKQCIINYHLVANIRDSFCNNVTNFRINKANNVMHLAKDYANDLNLKRISNIKNLSNVGSARKVRNVSNIESAKKVRNVSNIESAKKVRNTRSVSNIFFLHKNMNYTKSFHGEKNRNTNSPRELEMSKREWTTCTSMNYSRWKARLFSSIKWDNNKGGCENGKETDVGMDEGKEFKTHMNRAQETILKLRKSLRESFEKRINRNVDGVSIKDIYNILKKERNYLAVALLCLLISSLGQMFFPMCISKIINMYGGKEESLKYVMNEVYKTVFLIIGISTFSFFRIYFIETSIEQITRRLRNDLFENILNQKLSFFEKQRTGELINRLSNDIEVSSKLLIHISFGIRNFIAAIVGGICALHISPSKLFQPFLLPVTASLLIGTTYGKIVKQISILKQEKLSNCVDFASEKIHNINNVRLLNGEAFEKKEFKNYLNEVYKAGTKYSLVKAGNHFMFVSIISLFLLHLIYYGNYLIANKYINTGDLFSLIMYSLFCGSGIQGVMQSIGDLQKCIGSCSKVLQMINLPKSEFNEPWSKDTIHFLKSEDYSIKFDNVSFSYSTDEKIYEYDIPTDPSSSISPNSNLSNIQNNVKNNYALKNVSFFLPHNKSVAIVGKSGSGKTTILNLLSKKNAPNSGNILIGNFKIEKINSSALRYIQGVITQNPFLFNSSIKGNLLYPQKAYEQMLKEQMVLIEEAKNSKKYNKKRKKNNSLNNTKTMDNNMTFQNTTLAQEMEIDDLTEIHNYISKEIQNVQENSKKITPNILQDTYKDFHIHDFLSKHTNYDDIHVGVNGSFLSGGQKQRVYLAQNLLKNNKILILDEPTSSLDKLSENIINEALLKYMKGKTSIVFTHRLDLLNFVDYIGVLNDGCMVQFDLRTKVLQNPCDVLRQILNQSAF